MKYLLFFALSSLWLCSVSRTFYFCCPRARARFFQISSCSPTIQQTHNYFLKRTDCVCVHIFISHFSCSVSAFGKICSVPNTPRSLHYFPRRSQIFARTTSNNKACISKYSGWFSSCKTILKVFSIIYFIFYVHFWNLLLYDTFSQFHHSPLTVCHYPRANGWFTHSVLPWYAQLSLHLFGFILCFSFQFEMGGLEAREWLFSLCYRQTNEQQKNLVNLVWWR